MQLWLVEASDLNGVSSPIGLLLQMTMLHVIVLIQEDSDLVQGQNLFSFH